MPPGMCSDRAAERANVPSNTDDRLGANLPAGDPQALKQQADAYAEAGEYDRAEWAYHQAARLDPDRPAPYVGLGTVYLQTGQIDRAEWAFRIARRIAPDFAEAYGGLAMVYHYRNAYPSAFHMYLRCLELDSDNLVALLGLFQASCRMGTFEKITCYLERYLDMHPGDTAVLFCLATLYARDGKLLEARAALQEVLRLEPRKAQAAQLLAAVEARLAERTGARARRA